MFVNIPKSKKEGIQVLPIADVAAKDEFAGIKKFSHYDLVTALGVIRSTKMASPRWTTRWRSSSM